MSGFINDKKVKRLFIGQKEVKKAYFGKKLVFSGKCAVT